MKKDTRVDGCGQQRLGMSTPWNNSASLGARKDTTRRRLDVARSIQLLVLPQDLPILGVD